MSCVFAGVRGARNSSRNALQASIPLRLHTAMVRQGNVRKHSDEFFFLFFLSFIKHTTFVCFNCRQTPVPFADWNYRLTIQNMRSLKKTRQVWKCEISE